MAIPQGAVGSDAQPDTTTKRVTAYSRVTLFQEKFKYDTPQL